MQALHEYLLSDDPLAKKIFLWLYERDIFTTDLYSFAMDRKMFLHDGKFVNSNTVEVTIRLRDGGELRNYFGLVEGGG